MTRIGSLATGYGGLDLAIESVIPGASLAWVADIEPGPCKVLAHRFPGVPNLGDLTRAYWARVPHVDILTAGYPCQPFSHAGRRKGTDDERHLWPYIATAILALRPRLVVLENVAGHLSLGFGDVLGDLASLGYDAQWISLRAADVGACHGRRRVFIAAHPRGERCLERGLAAPGQATGGRSLGEPARRGGAPSLATGRQSWSDGFEDVSDASSSTSIGHEAQLLPTPAAGNFNDGEDPDQWEARRQRVKAATGNGNGMGTPLGIAVQQHDRWGRYATAIARHERMLGRPAPPPTEPGRHGRPRLSPRFEEWMMCLPAGWVTDVPNLTRNEQLRLLGNGVVPPQAIAALRWLLDMSRLEVAA